MNKNNVQDNFLNEFFEDKEISQKYSIQTDMSLTIECVKDWMRRKTALEEIFPSENYMESPHPLYEKEYPIGKGKTIENISEGLIKTYPITPIIQELAKMTGLPPSRITTINKDSDSDIPEMIKILIFDSEETVERYQIISQIMQKGGYYFDKKDSFVIRGHKGDTLYFRPIFPSTEIKNELSHYLYHITDATTAKKILKNGFYPKNKNIKGFKYPDRVHFFLKKNINLAILYAITAKKSAKTYTNNGLEMELVYTILKVDTSKIPNVQFYRDFDFDSAGKEAIFCYSYIPPTAIVDSKTFDFSKK